MYIGNTNFDILNIIYPILFIREIHKLKVLESNSLSVGIESLYKESYQSIVNSASRFTEIIDSLNSLKQDSLESISSIRTQVDKIQFLIMSNDIKIQSIISDISKTINNKLQDIVETDKLQNIMLTEKDLSNIIDICLKKKYLVTMEFEQIIRQFLEFGYQFIKIDDKYNFKCIKNKDNLCKIKVKKNKINLHFINNEKKHNLKYELCKEILVFFVY